jgi:hypothetical protein
MEAAIRRGRAFEGLPGLIYEFDSSEIAQTGHLHYKGLF